MQHDAIQRRRGLVQLLLERIGFGQRFGQELLVQALELLHIHMPPDRRAKQLFHPEYTRLGRKLVKELVQRRRTVTGRGNLDVVQHKDLVEPDLQVRNQVLAQEGIHPALDRFPDRRITGCRWPDSVGIERVRITLRNTGGADVTALKSGTDVVPEIQFRHTVISCTRFQLCAPPVRLLSVRSGNSAGLQAPP